MLAQQRLRFILFSGLRLVRATAQGEKLSGKTVQLNKKAKESKTVEQPKPVFPVEGKINRYGFRFFTEKV